MNERWNLSPLYSGFDSPEFAADMDKLDELIADYNVFADSVDKYSGLELVKNYISKLGAIDELAEKLMIYSGLSFEANTSDAAAQANQGKLMMKFSATASADAVLQAAIAKIADLDGLIKANPELEEFRFLLEKIQEKSKYLLSGKEEEIFARMNVSAASAWEDLHSALTSSVKVNYRGDTITLSQVRQLANDPDEAVRRDAYEAEIACYPQIDKSVAFAINNIKKQVLTECDLRGYPSALDKALTDSDMQRKTLDAMMEAIFEYLPEFWRFLRAKAKLLGYEGGLRWWDLFAPVGSSARKFTVEEARDYLLNTFGKVDKDIQNVIRRAFDEAWIDFYPREGKVGGAFDCGVRAIGQSRVLTNFTGDFSSVTTIAHELGHAFHDSRVFGQHAVNQGYSMPVAETASTFNENVVMSQAIAEAESREEKLALMEGQLSDAAQIICDITSRYLFETSVFENCRDEFLGPDRLCELMHDAQVKAYGDGLDESTLNKYMWLCKSHYYSGSLSFYNFPYAFGGLFARGLYARYLRMGADFMDVYKKMLTATVVNSVEDAAAIAGVDVTDKAFWIEGLESFKQEIDEFISLI